MSPAVTIANDGIKMPAKLRSLYQAQKPMITINLKNKRTVYTTMDRLEGTVTIVSPVDIKFDEIDIEFVGTARTYVERVTTAAAISGRSEAFHQFLKLQQPRIEEFFPQNGVLRAGQKYDLPFLFVIPQQLLPKICQHKIDSPAVRDAHLQLPPSFGDKEAQPKIGAVDDMVPDMASIRYGIFVRITKDKEQNDEVIKTTIASHAIRLRVVPATIEQPPLDMTGDNDDFNSRKEKTIKKGVLKGKLGTLVMEAAQPPSMRMFARTGSESQPSSIATIMLRFDPTDSNALPPKLGSLGSKLKVCTYFASTARANYPRRCMSGVDLSQGLHTEQMNLSSRCMANAEWTKRDPTKPETMQRRDSAFSISDSDAGRVPDASTAYKGGAYYTARLLVPITLPTNKVFVPTFHSCLVSRVYLLKLELNVQSATGIGGSMDLRLPLQISCAGATGEPQRQASIDAAMETQVDAREDSLAFFEPRTIRAPAEEFVGRSRIGSHVPRDDLPPDYSLFAPAYHEPAGVPAY